MNQEKQAQKTVKSVTTTVCISVFSNMCELVAWHYVNIGARLWGVLCIDLIWCFLFIVKQLFVNFDPQILELIQEAKCMQRLGLEVKRNQYFVQPLGLFYYVLAY